MKRQTCIRLLSCVLLSILLMTVCSMASPLFPLHTGVDQNCFLTVGKAMLSGTVPYRDLYEQKGPLLYGLHALAAWMDSNGFFGVYLLEILNLTWMLWLYCKIAGLFLPHRKEYVSGGIIRLCDCHSLLLQPGGQCGGILSAPGAVRSVCYAALYRVRYTALPPDTYSLRCAGWHDSLD